MRLPLLLLGLAATLSLAPAAHTPAAAAPAPPGVDAVLAGRNCGGTSKPAGLAALPAQTFGGAGWSVAGAVDPPPAASLQLRPSIAVDPAGRIFSAWQETRAGDAGDIFAAPLGASPPAGRRAVRVDDTGVTPVEQLAPSLAIDGAGTLHVVWEDLRGGANRRLFYASSANGGASWSANTLLTGALPALDHVSPHLIAGPGGALFLAWDGGNTIYFSRRAGGVWSAPAPINGPPAHDRDLPRLALDGQGRLFAVWEDRRNATAPQIFVARLDNPVAGSWGAEVRVSPLGAAQPSIAAGKGGEVYVAYQSGGIFVVRSGDGGATWSAPRRVDDGTLDVLTSPRLAVDAEGRVHCIWCELTKAPAVILSRTAVARSLDGGASWAGRAILGTSTETTEPLDLIASGDAIYAAWSDDSTGRDIIYTARWSEQQTLYLPLLRR